MRKTLFALCVCAGAVAAQPIGGGIKLGAPFTEAFKSISTASFQASPQRFVVGPFVEIRLPGQLSIEADALHQNLDFFSAGIGLNSGSWEFPVVLKHKMLPGPVKPYFEGGIVFSRLSDVKALVANHTQNFGLVAGGGVEIHLLLLKVSPEVRYEGFLLRDFDTTTPATMVQSKRNQFTFLVGFGF